LHTPAGLPCCRYWGNTPRPEVKALASAIHPAANSFRMSDAGLYAVFSTQLAEAAAKRRRPKGAAGGSPPTASAAAAAAGDDADAEDAAAAAGIPVVSADSLTPSGTAGRVECGCETDIFKALGLAYVPPHLRGRG
jgi:DNA polymerase lambda